MRYIVVSEEPTEAQVREIGAAVEDAAVLGRPGDFVVIWNEEQHDQPGWLSGYEVNIPGQPHRCGNCGEPI